MPDAMPDATAGLILAAGLSIRFGTNKLVAELDGRPILQHVLERAAEAGLSPVVVVVRSDVEALDDLTWFDSRRVINPDPESGISSSVRIGIAELIETSATRALVLLGDQPLLTVDQLRPLIATPLDSGRPIVVPRYNGRPGNPVLLERSAWPLAESLSGDAGMAQVIRAQPKLVRYVDVPGTNPDIDTTADLAAVSAAERGRYGRTAGEGRSRP